MKNNNIEMNIIVNNKPITEYYHNNKTFIEGRKGSKYEIEIKNYNSFTVEAVISVDGLSIIDGKEAGEKSVGYVLYPFQTIRIPGWKVNGDTAASFEFSNTNSSYSSVMNNSVSNNGVIGIMVYNEKKQNFILQNGSFNPYTPTPSVDPNPWGDGPLYKYWYNTNQYGSTSNDSNSYDSILRSMPPSSKLTSSNATVNVSSNTDNQYLLQELGTKFGDATTFNTTSISFERDKRITMFCLFYDSAKNLKARGIDLNRKHQKFINNQPQAFPGLSENCVPPKNWNSNKKY